jgi:undecaprenyl diphosphate synthase
MATLKSQAQNESEVPAHIAIIMDGNGRWAKRRFLNKAAGHRAGAMTLKKLSYEVEKIGVKYLTVYAFSTENWSRSKEEIDTLMNLLREFIQQYIDESKRNTMRISMIGDISRLPVDLQRKIEELDRITKEKKGLRIMIAMNYGGRDEIVRAMRKMASAVSNGNLSPDAINESLFNSYLDTSDIPDPDLLIRTSGEMRLSNFLLWQTAYTEFCFMDKFWPDFTIKDMQAAITQFQNRDRRFGGRK